MGHQRVHGRMVQTTTRRCQGSPYCGVVSRRHISHFDNDVLSLQGSSGVLHHLLRHLHHPLQEGQAVGETMQERLFRFSGRFHEQFGRGHELTRLASQGIFGRLKLRLIFLRVARFLRFCTNCSHFRQTLYRREYHRGDLLKSFPGSRCHGFNVF